MAWTGVLLVLATAGCATGQPGEGAEGRPAVVVTTSIWADVVEQVACTDEIEVTTLIPNGADTHTFELSIADRARLDGAELIVTNGLGLEEQLADPLDQAAGAGTPIFVIGDEVETIPYGTGSGDGPADEDPHVWQDPRRVADIVTPLARRLIDDGGLDADAIEACAASYVAKLLATDRDIERLVAGLPQSQRQLVTSHDSMGYFADRYGFEVIGTVLTGSAGLAESNPAELGELISLIEETGTRAIFVEPQHTADTANAVADVAGGIVVASLYTESLGPQGSGADSYLGLVMTNATTIVGALG